MGWFLESFYRDFILGKSYYKEELVDIRQNVLSPTDEF